MPLVSLKTEKSNVAPSPACCSPPPCSFPPCSFPPCWPPPCWFPPSSPDGFCSSSCFSSFSLFSSFLTKLLKPGILAANSGSSQEDKPKIEPNRTKLNTLNFGSVTFSGVDFLSHPRECYSFLI